MGNFDAGGKRRAGLDHWARAVFALIAGNIGIDHTTEFEANVGRPIMLVRNGSPIPGLLQG